MYRFLNLITVTLVLFSQDFQSLENSDSEATSWPQDQEDTPDLIPNYDIYEENQAQK
jgi:hypothetical protein